MKFSLKKSCVKSLPRSIWTNPIHFVACAFGFGALPWMPGTWATFAAIPICLILAPLPIWLYGLITFLLIILGVYVCGVTNRDFGCTDHPACAWDEMACFPLVLMGVPMSWFNIILGVVLFRFFDIVKPWPIGWLDKNIHGGIGVMIDDFAAALVSLAIMQVLLRVFS